MLSGIVSGMSKYRKFSDVSEALAAVPAAADRPLILRVKDGTREFAAYISEITFISNLSGETNVVLAGEAQGATRIIDVTPPITIGPGSITMGASSV